MLDSDVTCGRGWHAPSSVLDSHGAKAGEPWCRARRARCAACRPPSVRAMTLESIISARLHEDRLEHVRGVLTRVDRLLERLVDVLPADDRERVPLGAEELRDGLTGEPVALVLELAECVQLLLRVAAALEQLDGLV